MPFLSYAQNAEDVPLWRVFGGQSVGFYVDVGASSPDESVTRAFSQAGWTGLNLEPLPELFAQVSAARPRDINLAVAASDRRGTAMLFSAVGGLSTLEPGQSDRLNADGHTTTPVEVPLVPLADLFAEHVTRTIDFLKVDVEGHELQALAGNDWARWRPRVVLVEATEPNSRTPNHHGWEPILLAADYHFALFDGLNRFYVRGEDRDLIARLGVPANYFDDYQTFAHHTALARLDAATAAAADLGERFHLLNEQHHALSARHHAVSGELHALSTAHHALAEAHRTLNAAHDALCERHHELNQQHDALSRSHHQLNQQHHELSQRHEALRLRHETLSQQHHATTLESAERYTQVEAGRVQFADLGGRHHTLSQQHHTLTEHHRQVAAEGEARRQQLAEAETRAADLDRRLAEVTADRQRYAGWLGPFWWVRGRVAAAVRRFRPPAA